MIYNFFLICCRALSFLIAISWVFSSEEHFLRVKTHDPEDVNVVLYQTGVWMRICNYGLSAETPRVVCRHFGLPEYELSNNTISKIKIRSNISKGNFYSSLKGSEHEKNIKGLNLYV